MSEASFENRKRASPRGQPASPGPPPKTSQGCVYAYVLHSRSSDPDDRKRIHHNQHWSGSRVSTCMDENMRMDYLPLASHPNLAIAGSSHFQESVHDNCGHWRWLPSFILSTAWLETTSATAPAACCRPDVSDRLKRMAAGEARWIIELTHQG